MTADSQKHDLKNALIFLVTFPEILKQELQTNPRADSPALKELLEIYRAKIAILQAGLQK